MTKIKVVAVMAMKQEDKYRIQNPWWVYTKGLPKNKLWGLCSFTRLVSLEGKRFILIEFIFGLFLLVRVQKRPSCCCYGSSTVLECTVASYCGIGSKLAVPGATRDYRGRLVASDCSRTISHQGPLPILTRRMETGHAHACQHCWILNTQHLFELVSLLIIIYKSRRRMREHKTKK